MAKITFPLYATLKTAAALFEMKKETFLGLINQGVLSKARKIGAMSAGIREN